MGRNSIGNRVSEFSPESVLPVIRGVCIFDLTGFGGDFLKKKIHLICSDDAKSQSFLD